MAGSASGQDEANPVLVPQKRNSVGVMFWPYNKSLIDRACSVKMNRYWPRSFLRF